MPPVTGSLKSVKLLSGGLKDLVGAAFAKEPDPYKEAELPIGHIQGKRAVLSLDSRTG